MKKIILLSLITIAAININAETIKIKNKNKDFKAVKVTYWQPKTAWASINIQPVGLANPIIGSEIITLEGKNTKKDLNIPKRTIKLSFIIINHTNEEFNLVVKMNGWFNFDTIQLPEEDIKLEIEKDKIELKIGKTKTEYKLENDKFIKIEKE